MDETKTKRLTPADAAYGAMDTFWKIRADEWEALGAREEASKVSGALQRLWKKVKGNGQDEG